MADRRNDDDGGGDGGNRAGGGGGGGADEASAGLPRISPTSTRASIGIGSFVGSVTSASGAPPAPADFMSSWLGDSVNTGGAGLAGDASLGNLDFSQSFGNMSLIGGSALGGTGGGGAAAFGNRSVPASSFHASSVGPTRHRRTGSSEQMASSAGRARGSLSLASRSVSVGGQNMGGSGGGGGEGGGFESSLHDAARVTDWTEVHRLALAQPRMARFAGPDGWTALHHSLSRRGCPPQVVKALILAFPGALIHPNESKWTPLHFACRFKAPREVVRILLDASPGGEGRRAASMRCSKGRTALYYAVRYDAPDGVEELLLDAHPGAVLDEDRDGVSPLALVWDKYATRLEGKQALHPYLNRAPPGAEANKSVVLGGKLKARWLRADRLLRAAFRFPYQDKKKKQIAEGDEKSDNGNGGDPQNSPDNGEEGEKPRKWRVLHATAAIKCHSSLFELAAVLHPDQASEVDEGDLYGAHGIDAESRLGHSRAVKKKAPPEGVVPGENPDAAGEAIGSSHRTALHFAALSPARGRAGRTVLATLLRLHPAAAAASDGVDGSLPLHLLAENGRKGHWVHDGVAELCAAHPEAVRAVDEKGRTPLHRACAVASQRGAGGGGLGGGVPAAPAQQQAPPPQAPVGQQQAGAPAPPAAAAVVDDDEAETHSVGSILQNLLRLHTAAASAADACGRLPLHVLASRCETWDADAEAVLAAHPAAARARTARSVGGRLPLHLACVNAGARPNLLRRLIDAHPRGPSQADGKGKLPLHLACEMGREWDGVGGTKLVYDAFPAAIKQPEENGRGWHPLHLAAASGGLLCGAGASELAANMGRDGRRRRRAAPRVVSSLALLAKLAELYPEAASLPDKRGRYPLHLACASGKRWEEDAGSRGGVTKVFRACPDAAIAEDGMGYLPFHAAAVNLCRAEEEKAEERSGGEDGIAEEEPEPSPLPPARELSVVSDESSVVTATATASGGNGAPPLESEEDVEGGVGQGGWEAPGASAVEEEDESAAADALNKINLVYNLVREAPIVLKM